MDEQQVTNMNNNDTAINSADNKAQKDIVISLKDISKKYNLYNKNLDRLKESLHPRRKKYHHDFYALKNINLEVKRGEVLGIVGKNGSGKSTLLKIISSILTPTTGSVEIKGKVVALLELGAGFNPEFTGMENIYFYCSLLGFDRKQSDSIVGEIIDFAEVGDYIHQPIKTYSSGMMARLAFSVSVNVDPDILILDEVLSVGDELFRRKCYARMESFFNGGKTILFVSHSVQSINELCTKTVLLDKGEFILDGPTKMVTMYYQKYLFAEKGNESDVMKEIIELNNNIKLKNEIFFQLQDDQIEQNYYNDRPPDAGNSINNDGKDEKKAPYFMQNLKPKSTVVYRNYDVDIYNLEIRSLNDNQVNVLIFNETYYLCYKVNFGINAENVSFSMAILNFKGLNISSIGGLINRKPTGINAEKGDRFLIKWKFKNILTPGIYYANIQVSGDIEKHHMILSRVHDAIAFKSDDYRQNRLGGLVSLEQSLLLERINGNKK